MFFSPWTTQAAGHEGPCQVHLEQRGVSSATEVHSWGHVKVNHGASRDLESPHHPPHAHPPWKMHKEMPSQPWLVWLRGLSTGLLSLIPSQGTCLGCGFSPRLGCIQEATDQPIFLLFFKTLTETRGLQSRWRERANIAARVSTGFAWNFWRNRERRVLFHCLVPAAKCTVFLFKISFLFREGKGGGKRGREMSMCGCL